VVLVGQVRVVVTFDPGPDDSDEQVAHFTRELELDLREVGVVEYLPAAPARDAKGVGEVVAATVAVLTAAEPTYAEALVRTVVAFVRRHEGRRAHLKVGSVELAIDQPSGDEVAELIQMPRSVIERHVVERAEG
jgi:hypothetical protein